MDGEGGGLYLKFIISDSKIPRALCTLLFVESESKFMPIMITGFTCYQTKPNQTKPNQTSVILKAKRQ
jgi:hypothetical protein